MTLGNKLRQLRQERGLTTREVSKLFNVGKSTISNYETDYRKPDADMLKRLADFYEVTVDYLLGRTTDRETYIIEKEVVPKALREAGVEYIELLKDMQGLSPELIKSMLNTMQQARNMDKDKK